MDYLHTVLLDSWITFFLMPGLFPIKEVYLHHVVHKLSDLYIFVL